MVPGWNGIDINTDIDIDIDIVKASFLNFLSPQKNTQKDLLIKNVESIFTCSLEAFISSIINSSAANKRKLDFTLL